MKKITFLLFISIFSMNVFAQDPVGVTFDITNKADFQLNGETELTFKPGQTVTFNIEYTLGTTNGNPNTLFFLFARIENAVSATMNAGAEGAGALFFGAGTESGGVWTTSATYTMEGDAGATLPLTSADPTVGYRMNIYMAYYKEGLTDGPNQVYGGFGGADQPDVFIRSQGEIDVLSIENFNKTKLSAFYSANRDAVVVKDHIEGDFSIYNLMGQAVLEGKTSNEINVESLKTGLYILATEGGTLKFVR